MSDFGEYVLWCKSYRGTKLKSIPASQLKELLKQIGNAKDYKTQLNKAVIIKYLKNK